MNKTIVVIAVITLLLGGAGARGQESGALLDLLVRKKIITDQEAEEIRGELTKEFSQTPAGKLKISNPVTELEIYGDGRVRYEIRAGNSGAPGTLVTNPNDLQQRNRARYRLRLGLRGTLMDDFFFGLRLETSASPRSTNVTFGDDAGPFGKTSDAAFIGQAYVGYRGFRDITLTAGRMPNPFITTSMVWDGDINPEGLAQQYKHTFAPGGKNLEVFANFGQFLYDDQNPENPIGRQPVSGGRRVPENDAFLIGYQGGAKYNFTKDISLHVAPTIYHYTGYGNDFNTLYDGDPNFRVGTTTTVPNQTGINSLLVFNMPAEFGFKIGELPARVFGDFALNLDAADRARAAGNPDEDDERYAYQIGIGVGQLKVKKDWQVNVFWQHTEQYALDPNLVDSDIFDSRVNMEGVAVQAGYAISDAITLNLTYAYGEQINNRLGTGGVGDIGVNPLREYQLFQADLNFKF